MNKLFNKGRKHRILSLFVVFAMVLTLLPANMVKAETKTYTINEIKAESDYGFTINTEGKAVYDETEGAKAGNYGKLRVRAYVPDDYVFTAGDVITMSYETNIDGIKVYGGYHNNNTFSMGSISSSGSTLTYTVTDADAAIFAGNTSNDAEFFRFKADAGADATDAYLSVTSVIITQEVTGGDNNGNAGGTEGGNAGGTEGGNAGGTEGGNAGGTEGGNAGGTEGGNENAVVPTVEFSSIKWGTNLTGTTGYENELFAIQYTNAIKWETFAAALSGVDVTQYSTMKIEITPSRDGMIFGIADNAWKATLCDKVLSAGRQVVEVDLTKAVDASVLRLYFDNLSSDYVSETPITAVIHNITLTGYIGSNDSGDGDGNGDGNGSGNTGDGAVQPTVTKGWIGDCYTDVTNNYDGAVMAVSYTTAVQWSQAFVSVTGHDVAAHDTVLINIEPSRENMNLCIQDQSNTIIYGWTAVDARKTLEIPLTQNVTDFKFMFDSQEGGYEAGEEITAIVHSIEFVNSKVPTGPVEVAAVLKRESSSSVFDIDEQGRLYSATGGKLRGALDFPEGFRVEAGGVLTINYDTDLPSFKAEFTYGNGGNDTYFTENFSAGQNSLVINITDAWVDYFAGNTDYANAPTRARLKVDSTTGTYIAINSVTYTAPGSVESEPVIPSWGVKGGPTVTLDTSSNGYTCKVNNDKSVDITYNAPTGWKSLNATVENSNFTKYSQLVVDITPVADMIFYVWDDKDKTIGEKYTVESSERQKLKFNMTADTTRLQMWIDPHVEADVTLEGQQNIIIHSIKIVDPEALPDSKANFTTFSGTVAPDSSSPSSDRVDITFESQAEGGYAKLNYTEDCAYARLFANFTDYTYNAGDMLVVYSDDLQNASFEQVFIGYSDGDGEYVNLSGTFADGKTVYKLPEATFKSGNQPTMIRFKGYLAGTSTTINGMYIWDAATYNEVLGSKYKEGQIPTGLAVTYYDNIYSRGFAWMTDGTVEDNSLWYVKAEDGITTDVETWGDKAQEVKADKTAEQIDVEGNEWHIFKAKLEGLEARAVYYYRVGNEATGWSPVGSCTIDGTPNDGKYTFVHVTDSQEDDISGFNVWAKILREAYSKAPSSIFVAHTGDLVNDSENPKKITTKQWSYCFDQPKDTLMNTVLLPAPGNHEEYDYTFTDQFNIKWADYEPNSRVDELTGGCYSVTYGDKANGILFISLNANDSNDGDKSFKTQKEWLVQQLDANKDYKWKVVQIHKGMMSGGDHTNDGEVDWLRDELPPIFAKYEVDLVLQGHDHVYTRSRSYYYGDNPFEEGTQYFDGHTAAWAETQTLEPGKTSKDGSVTNTLGRTIYLEPLGTHYVTINTCGTKTYPEEPEIDEVIFEGDNPINPLDKDGNGGCLVQPKLPMYGIVTIDGDFLIYDSYTYKEKGNVSTLYDSFAVSKSNKSGYNPEDPHEGKDEVKLYGIEMIDNPNGGAPMLNIKGFNASIPQIMDYTSFKYTIEGTDNSYKQVGTGDLFTGTNGKGIIPTEKGKYTLKVEIPQSNRYYWGETVITFEVN